MVIVFQQKKKKKTILPTKTKKSFVIREVKTKFFATTVNWCNTN